jgi:sulfur carrier protein
MRVLVNGLARSVMSGTTLGQVVDSLDRGRSGVAAAVNEQVVPRSLWDSAGLADGDRVEILTAAQGG